MRDVKVVLVQGRVAAVVQKQPHNNTDTTTTITIITRDNIDLLLLILIISRSSYHKIWKSNESTTISNLNQLLIFLSMQYDVVLM